MQKREKILYRACAVFLSVLVILFALVAGVMIANSVADKNVRYTPDYERIDLAPILEKGDLTDGDYDVLYRQTGLTKIGVQAVLQDLVNTETPLSRLREFQEAFFAEQERLHETISPITQRDYYAYPAPFVPLETGDVIVSASTHSLGWRHGHAAIVVNNFGTTLESICLGVPSALTTNGFEYFAECSTFMVLRMKDADKKTREEIGAAARKELCGIPYSISVGVFSKKDQGRQAKMTQCAHLVWQAYKNFGYDIDYNGGAVVAPCDIARSPYFEVVQIYGFHPDKLW